MADTSIDTPENRDIIRDAFLDGVKFENELNREGDILPYGYMHPGQNGKLVWICNYDKDKNIMGVFRFENELGRIEKKIDALKSIDEAKYHKEELIKNGWVKFEPPKVEFKMSDGKGNSVPLNRKYKRQIGKTIDSMTKNGFKNEKNNHRKRK